MSSCNHSFFNSCLSNRGVRRLITLEELEMLRVERQRGCRYINRINQCGSNSIIRLCLGLDQVK